MLLIQLLHGWVRGYLLDPNRFSWLLWLLDFGLKLASCFGYHGCIVCMYGK